MLKDKIKRCSNFINRTIAPELIGFNPSRNNHGCRDYAVGKITGMSPDGDYIVKIIEAQSCHSCWQVGHDMNHIFYKVGDIVNVDILHLKYNNDEWSKDITFTI